MNWLATKKRRVDLELHNCIDTNFVSSILGFSTKVGNNLIFSNNSLILLIAS